MASRTTTARLVTIRDKLLDAIDKLAGEGVTSYSVGDQTFSLADVGDLMAQVDKLDRQIEMRSSTLTRPQRNRATFKHFNG